MIKSGEPEAGVVLGGTGLRGLEHSWIFHAGLTAYDPDSNLQPRLAVKVPSLDDGDWKALPDGRMEVTWKLRPDARWHDGAPIAAADFTLGLAVLQDPELPFASEEGRLIAEASAADPTTLVVVWRKLYPFANASGPLELPAVPAHILGDLYRAGDKQAVINAPYWAREFVGLGPYRLGDWVPGSHLEALAFDDYFLGRPKIDRLVLRYVGDANVLYLNLLAGELDAIPFGSFQADHFVLAKQNWEARGAGTALAVFFGTRNYRFQFRDADAPWARDVRVRRAIIHMLDRQALVDGLLDSASSPADTLVAPNDPIYRLLEQRGLTRYPYDPAQAQRLMLEAGWTKGIDGPYRSAAGAPFVMTARAQDFVANVKEVEAVAGQLKASGVEATPALWSSTGGAAEINETRATTRGLIGMPLREPLSFISAEVASEANRWRGANYGGYSNPTYDRLYDESLVTLDAGRRQGLIADMLKIEADQAISIHLYYSLAQQTVFFRTGVRGPGLVSTQQLATAWNIHTWEMD